MWTDEGGSEGGQPVEGYGSGFFRVAGAVHEGPLALLPSGPAPWAGLPEIGPFLELAGRIDVLLMGMGPEIRPLDPGLRHALVAAGIGVEIMGTPAACRTYNLLLVEGRRVAAALVPV
jgi:uncharacterized protein